MHPHHEDAAGGRAGVRKAQVERAKAQFPTQLATVQHMAAHAVGPAQQRLDLRQVTGSQRGAHGGTRDTQAVHLVAHHARDVEAPLRPGGVEHGVVAGPAGSEVEVVADQHVTRAQPAHEHAVDEVLRRHRGQAIVEPCHHHMVDAAALQLGQLVAQRGDARRRQFGPPGLAREVVARVGLEGQHT
jgi:hypothetical protein